MNYDLALKLKNAGFPQDGKGKKITDDGFTDRITSNTREWAYIPTLEELIEACGGEAKALIQQDNHTVWEYAVDGKGEIGSTPEEAVANLYLALHEIR